ncbi:MAG: hypothetical protein LBS57_06155 [Treponema sp.]|jgi:hypothetical protein|nr:hypothetical protein [Treponema sp.]
MKKILPLLLMLAALAAQAQSVYVEDFTAAQEDIRPLMSGATDVVRSALLQNTLAEFTGNRSAAAYIVSGTVTRFGAVKPPDKNSGGNFSGSVNVAIQLFNFLAPALQTGHIASQNTSGRRTRQQQDDEPQVVVNARLVEIRTGRIVTAAGINALTWEDYLAKAADLARELGRALPFPETAFSGVWEAVIEHGGREDSYRLNFRAGGQCNVNVSSADSAGNVSSQSADGRYTWNNEILTVSARFPGVENPRPRAVNWRVVVSFAPDRRSFTVVIPMSDHSGAERVRAQFWKEPQ